MLICPKGIEGAADALPAAGVKGHGQAGEAWAEEVVRPTAPSTGKGRKGKKEDS